MEAAREESDHLAWTKQRIDQLGGRVSILNPLWYGGALAFGYLSGRFGDKASLGFMRETERQVEAHLDSHLEDLPEADLLSRQIVQAMKQDEQAHAEAALKQGASPIPEPIQWMMRKGAKVMTKTAYYV
jgi:ubiquinone biosynthesis monooxygenase Coq7